jgi:hypothetical protein
MMHQNLHQLLLGWLLPPVKGGYGLQEEDCEVATCAGGYDGIGLNGTYSDDPRRCLLHLMYELANAVGAAPAPATVSLAALPSRPRPRRCCTIATHC